MEYTDVFTLFNTQVDVIECMHLAIAEDECPLDAAEINHALASLPSHRRRLPHPGKAGPGLPPVAGLPPR